MSVSSLKALSANGFTPSRPFGPPVTSISRLNITTRMAFQPTVAIDR